MPKHEITQIFFYDSLGAPDKYLLDAASGGIFMSKYEDEALELIELVAENSHQILRWAEDPRKGRNVGCEGDGDRYAFR